uniref:7TM GPCR serpentine receptor class x (Srx) domain-containing protein n=1 Tax=Romanomermis culicivorax TaxID=13658 RepID=A0A915L0K6_ROMCU
MNNTNSNNTDITCIVIGISFIPLSIIGLVLNILVFMAVEQNHNLSRTFYIYSLNYLVSDCLGLISEGIYTGLSAALNTTFSESMEQVMALVTLVAWFSKGGFLVLLSASRFYILSRSYLVENLVTNRQKAYINASCWLVWLFFTLFYSNYFFVGDKYLWLNTQNQGWELKKGSKNLWIEINILLYKSYNVAITVIILGINCAILIIVRKKMHRLTSVTSYTANHQSQDLNRKREVKLFVQCSLTCALYLFGVLTSLGFGSKNVTIVRILRYWQIVVNMECAVVYLALNHEIRNTIKNWFIECKF